MATKQTDAVAMTEQQLDTVAGGAATSSLMVSKAESGGWTSRVLSPGSEGVCPWTIEQYRYLQLARGTVSITASKQRTLPLRPPPAHTWVKGEGPFSTSDVISEFDDQQVRMNGSTAATLPVGAPTHETQAGD